MSRIGRICQAWVICLLLMYLGGGAWGAVNNPFKAGATVTQGPDATGNQGYPMSTVPATGSAAWPVQPSGGGTPFVVSVESPGNQTDTPLIANATFTGAWEDVSQYVSLEILINSSANGAASGAVLQWSHDAGVTIDATDTFTHQLPPGRQFNYTFPIRGGAKYFRLVYQNGGSILSSFHVHTWYRSSSTLQSIQVQKGTSNIWLPVNGNQTLRLLSSSARTTAQSDGPITNNNWRGAIFILTVTAVPAVPGTGGLDFQIRSFDTTGASVLLNLPLSSKITAIGTYVWIIYPGAAATGSSMNIKQVLSLPLPATWGWNVTVGDAQSYTYGLLVQQQQ